jgi:hypothetical protein
MGNAATQSKQRWNSKHYTQLKISVAPETAAAFKAACASSGVSMAGELSQYMSGYSKTAGKSGRPPVYATKRRRRAAVKSIVQELERIKPTEEHSRDNIPENLQGAEIFENADQCVSSPDEAIELPESIYRYHRCHPEIQGVPYTGTIDVSPKFKRLRIPVP